jgi:hypothetical protein
VGSQTAKRRRPPCWDLVQKRGWEDVMNRRCPHTAQIPEKGTRCTRSSHHCILVACRDKRLRGLWVTWHQDFRRVVSETEITEIDPS